MTDYICVYRNTGVLGFYPKFLKIARVASRDLFYDD